MRGDIDLYDAEDGGIEAPTGVIGVGADLWFTSIGNGRVGRVRDGRLELYGDPKGAVSLPANIFPGSDGRVWFTCLGSDRLGAIDPQADDPAGTIQTYRSRDVVRPVALKSDLQGRLWTTLRGSEAIASFDPRQESRQSSPLASLTIHRSDSIAQPSALFVLSDGRVWWVNAGNATIGALDPGSGDIVSFGPWPRWGTPRAWAAGSDGTIWVTTQCSPGLLRLDPAAVDVTASAAWFTDDRLRSPDGVWCASDGAVWLCDTDAGQLVRFDPGTQAWSGHGAGVLRGPFDIKAGGEPEGPYLWFSDKVGNTIGRVET